MPRRGFPDGALANNFVAGRQIFMQKRISTLPFKGTAEQKSKLDAVIAEHKSQPGAVMPVLQKAQDIYGYLPIEVQMMIADGLGVSLEKVYGVSTFYSRPPRASTTSRYVSAPLAMSRVPALCSTSSSRSLRSSPRNAHPTDSSHSRLAAASAPAVWLPFSPSTTMCTDVCCPRISPIS